MRLRRIELAGFGCLRDFSTEFAPGINVVYGLNEAGKSTLQQAVCAMLYGFYEGERGKPDEKRRHERFRPWATATEPHCPYRGTLEYDMDCGETFEVRREFASADIPTQLIDLSLGSDVASHFGLGRHGNVPFARRQLGMSRGVFQSCAFIAQGEIFEASQGANPREIGDAIAAMADSARRDVSAAAALGRLDALMLRIGTDRARTAELPKARENLRRALAELDALDRARATVAERSMELEHSRMRLNDLERDILALRAQYLMARRNSLTRRLEALRDLDATMERARGDSACLRAYESFPAHLRDRVVTLADRRNSAANRASAARLDVEKRRAEISDPERLEYEALRVSVGALSDESLKDLEGAAYSQPPPENKAGLIARIYHRIGEAIAGFLRWVFRRQPDAPAVAGAQEDEPGAPSLTSAEALVLLERHRRYLTLRPAVEALEEAGERLRQEEQVLSSAAADLAEVVSAEPAMEPDAAVAAFFDGCEKRAAYDCAVDAAREAEQQRETLLGGRSSDDIEAQLSQCRERLELLLAANSDLDPSESSDSTAVLADRLKALEDKRHELELYLARLGEEVRGALGDQRAHADIEEDVESWRRETARLERSRTSARMAREVIDEAMTDVYRDFAPAVSSFLSDGFAHVTEGRYQRAHVDPKTLEVSLLLPETQRVIKDPTVSRGTLALAYILMRIGLAQHMSAVAEPVPLVLDDPFIDLDEYRLRLTLDFILEMSERMQVLLFTKDPAVLRWFETKAEGDRHHLHALDRLRQPAAIV